MDNLFPDGAAYDLSKLALDYKSKWDLPESKTKAILADAKRLLSRKGHKQHEEQLDEVKARIEEQVKDEDDLIRIAKEIILARRFAEAYRQSDRKPGGPIHNG